MTESSKIPFNQPCLTGRELVYIADAIKRQHASGDGHYSKMVHNFFEQNFGIYKALLTTSCTHALEMAAILCEIQEGDEVIVPSYTFTSTVNAFVLRGAKPVFCDVNSLTMNIDETLIEPLVTPKTKAIVVVHYAGVGCEMDEISRVARKYNLRIIEDNAQGIFGKYKGRYLGTFGDFGTLSFHETKNINCGEGGALFVNNPIFVERAEVIREKGTNRSKFFRGEVDKYSWVDMGSSFLPSDMLAAYLWAQLEVWPSIMGRRKKIWETYLFEIASWAKEFNVQTPFVPAHVDQSFHLFYLVFPNLELRTQFIAFLNKKNIKAAFHYQALNVSPMGLSLGGMAGQCPVSEKMSDCLVRLPFYNGLGDVELDYIISSIIDFRPEIQSNVWKTDLAA